MSKLLKNTFIGLVIATVVFPGFSLNAHAIDKTSNGHIGDSIQLSGQPSPTFPNSLPDKAYTLSESTLENQTLYRYYQPTSPLSLTPRTFRGISRKLLHLAPVKQ